MLVRSRANAAVTAQTVGAVVGRCLAEGHPRCLRGEYRAGLLEAFAAPAPLLEGALSVGDRIAVLPSVFHLMWTGALAADLASAPLDGGSLVSAAGGVR